MLDLDRKFSGTSEEVSVSILGSLHLFCVHAVWLVYPLGCYDEFVLPGHEIVCAVVIR